MNFWEFVEFKQFIAVVDDPYIKPSFLYFIIVAPEKVNC